MMLGVCCTWFEDGFRGALRRGAGRGTEIAVFAKTRLELLRQFVPLDPEAFRAAFMRFMAVSDTLVRAA